LIKEFSRLYIGVLNHYDLIISKLFRCTSVDVDDCLMLMKARRHEIDINTLRERFKETAQYDITEAKMMSNWDHFEKNIVKEGLYGK
jgi:predicted nucleotidyltransferase